MRLRIIQQKGSLESMLDLVETEQLLYNLGKNVRPVIIDAGILNDADRLYNAINRRSIDVILISETPQKNINPTELAELFMCSFLTILFESDLSKIKWEMSRQTIFKCLKQIVEEVEAGKIIPGSISSLSFSSFSADSRKLNKVDLASELIHDGFVLQRSLFGFASKNSDCSQYSVFFKAPKFLTGYITGNLVDEQLYSIKGIGETKRKVEIIKFVSVYNYDSGSLSEMIWGDLNGGK
jgi:hypothetical protein